MGLKRLNNFINTNLSNFREIHCGNIGSGKLFRSSHPIPDNKQDRSIGLLAVRAGIATVINLSDTKAELRRKAVSAPWYNRLYRKGSIIALGMPCQFSDDSFAKKMRQGLVFMLEHDTPYLIHCHAGIDRTGFVCAVLEGLSSAAMEEIIKDYLLSHKVDENYTKENPQYQLDALVILEFLAKLNNGIPVNDGNLQQAVRDYLVNKSCLKTDEIDCLKEKLA
jgi:protein tyrosine/serine phosphatase